MPDPISPYKRVRHAFSQQALKRVCEMHETEFADAYDMGVRHVQQTPPDDFYVFKDHGSDILAVAHLDTVINHDRRTASFVTTQAGPVVFSGALDDRLGAYTILELLPKLGIQYDILLTVGEESGRSTAQFFEPPKEYNWMIEFDRGGSDVVMYQYDDSQTRSLVQKCGAKPASGAFSDISYLEHLEIKGFNWGVGYQNYHGPRGHAFLDDYWGMIGHFLKFHEANYDTYLPHENIEPNWYSGYRGWSGGGGSYRSLSGERWWDDDKPQDDVIEMKADSEQRPIWEDDSIWEDAEWDAYIEGGLDAVREVFERRGDLILDDDGDLVSEDFNTVSKALERIHSSNDTAGEGYEAYLRSLN